MVYSALQHTDASLRIEAVRFVWSYRSWPLMLSSLILFFRSHIFIAVRMLCRFCGRLVVAGSAFLRIGGARYTCRREKLIFFSKFRLKKFRSLVRAGGAVLYHAELWDWMNIIWHISFIPFICNGTTIQGRTHVPSSHGFQLLDLDCICSFSTPARASFVKIADGTAAFPWAEGRVLVAHA